MLDRHIYKIERISHRITALVLAIVKPLHFSLECTRALLFPGFFLIKQTNLQNGVLTPTLKLAPIQGLSRIF